MAKTCVVIPVYNEERDLEWSVENVLKVCKKNYKNFEILIADNASTDQTPEIAKKLSKKYKPVKYIHLDKKGRGRALKKAWSTTDSEIMCYMDVDLSTNLKFLKPLTDAIEEGYDISFGSRHKKGSEVDRSVKREILSRGYNLILKLILKVQFNDAQCGFKAINRKVLKEIISTIDNNEWFLDTELLVKGERWGYKLKEIPVKWVEDKGSTVNVKRTVESYLRNIFRLKKRIKDCQSCIYQDLA
jgi:glycosyltransferase involved in cell wall biosynthesis